MVQLIQTAIASIYHTGLIQIARWITHVVSNQSIVQIDLRFSDLDIRIGVVETETISQCETFHRLGIHLQFSIYLLCIAMVIVVCDCPIWIGDSVRSQPCLRSIERKAQILLVNQRDITRELIQTINNRCTLIGIYHIGFRAGKIDRTRYFQPIYRLITTAERNCMALICIFIARHYAVITSIGIRCIIRH